MPRNGSPRNREFGSRRILSSRSACTAVCNIADDPASVLVCLKRDSSFGQRLLGNSGQQAAFSINVLAADQQALLDHLMQSSKEERFSMGDWQASSDGVPFLADASCAMHCELLQCHDVDTHCVCIARIVAAQLTPGAGTIVFHDKQFHTLTSNP